MDDINQKKLHLEKIEHVYQKYNRVLLSEVRKHYTNDQYIAEDIVQTTFLRALKYGQNLKKSDDKSVFRFLYAIMKYVALDTIQEQKYNYIEDNIEYILNHCTDSIISSELNPEFLYMERTVVREAIRKLPDRYVTILYLFYYHGYSFKEIGSFLGISPNAAAQKCHYVRQKLKDILIKEGFHDAGKG